MADERVDDLAEGPSPLAPGWRDLVAPLLADRRRLAGGVAALLLLLGVVLAGYVLLRTPAAPATELTLPMAGAGSTVPPGPTTTVAPAELLVHAAGAVVHPGVHAVPSGSRVADLLAAAGGPAADADLDRVNLAALLADGERVWFPRLGEAVPPVVAADAVGGGSGTAEAPAGPIDLNTATADQLDALPGIGPAIAAAIVSHREEHGPFATVDDLLDVPGIGDAKLAQLRDLVTV